MEPKSEVRTRRDHVVAALLGAVLAGTVALLTWIGSARGAEYTTFHAMRIADMTVASDSVVLSEPAGWQAGDPLAVVIVGGPDRDTLRTRLIADLLAARVAVAELIVAADLQDPESLVADAYRTLEELMVHSAPGQVLLYGFAWDAGGHAALAAARPGTRERLAGADGPHYAAHASLGTGCQVATPRWNEGAEWCLHAIFQGERAWTSDERGESMSEIDFSITALACALALVPTTH
jgi:hypothetical protein